MKKKSLLKKVSKLFSNFEKQHDEMLIECQVSFLKDKEDNSKIYKEKHTKSLKLKPSTSFDYAFTGYEFVKINTINKEVNLSPIK